MKHKLEMGIALKLKKESIIEAGFKLLDMQGLDKFNLRELAKSLDVSATALYWHFDNKDQLLSAMSAYIYSRGYSSLSAEKDWEDSLLNLGRSLLEAMNEHRDAALLVATSKPGPKSPPVHARTIAEPLVRAGLPLNFALFYESNVIAFVLGWALYYQNKLMYESLRAMMDFDSTFETGLRALVVGFREEQKALQARAEPKAG